MSKHTAGPWHVTVGMDQMSDPGTTIWHSGSGLHPVGVYSDADAHGDALADANLIAAAPELLGACLAMIEWDDRENDHAVSFEDRMNLCREAFEKARVAISKATGATHD